MANVKLFMIMLGCKPPGRFTEQHDIYFGIGESLADLKPGMERFWKEAPRLHIDGWREVTAVDGYSISVEEKPAGIQRVNEQTLFFINLGGYRKDEFDEFHYKLLTIAPNSGEAVRTSRETAFFKHTGFEGANAHIDDKYGVDVDDIINIEEILSEQYTSRYCLRLSTQDDLPLDTLHLGYLKWEKI